MKISALFNQGRCNPYNSGGIYYECYQAQPGWSTFVPGVVDGIS
jgi:hypothetical protein